MSEPTSPPNTPAAGPSPRLLDQLREAAQRRGHLPPAITRFVDWSLRYIRFHQRRHPLEMGAPEIGRFYAHVVRTEAPPVDRLEEAAAALEFLYKEVLHRDVGAIAMSQPPRLLDQVRQAIRVRHYSPRTEECYVQWATRYIRFHGMRHPREMGAAEIEAFLTDLAVQGHVRSAGSTRCVRGGPSG